VTIRANFSVYKRLFCQIPMTVMLRVSRYGKGCTIGAYACFV